MSDPAAPLAAHLGYWLRFVSNHVSHAFARKLETRNVTVAEWVVLRELFETDGLAPSRLAERLGMTRGAISKLADRLAAKALAVRTASATDGRGQTLALTDAGRALVPTLAELAGRNEAEFFADIPPGDLATVERVMRAIVERRRLTAIPID